MTELLSLHRVTKRFRGVVALDAISLVVRSGEIIGLIGPNGAGKTTLVNVVTGVHRLSDGTIRFEGESITRLRPDQIARRGISRTFQIVQPFPEMSVLENVAAAAMFGGGARSVAEARTAAREWLSFCGLDAEAEKSASSLTLAGRKRLELAKGLALRPKLLLLDEVNAGLNPAEIDRALDLIGAIAASGITVLLIEHLMKVVTRACTRVVVLHHGRLIADGRPDEIVSDARVIEAYLGRRFAERHRVTVS